MAGTLEVRYAELIRPVIGRAYFGVRYGVRGTLSALAGRRALSPGVLPDLGAALMIAPLSTGELGELYRYKAAWLAESLALHEKQGVLARNGDSWALTPEGRGFAEELWSAIGAFAEELWKPSARVVPVLTSAVDRLLERARTTAGAGFAALDREYAYEGALALYVRLGVFRYHRADAHAAAWRAAGLTADTVVAMSPGPEREAIEAETGRRDAGVYAGLSVEERFELMSRLGSLPG